MDFTTSFSQHFEDDSCFSEKVVGKLNRPKTSVNLTIGTNKNLDSWFWVKLKTQIG